MCKGAEFKEMHFAEISYYLSEVKGTYIDPDDVLDSLIQWMSQDQTNRSSQIKDLLMNVDIGKCSLQCLEEKLKQCESLDEHVTFPDLLKEQVQEISKLPNTRTIRGGYNVKAVIPVVKYFKDKDESHWFRGFLHSVADFCRVIDKSRHVGTSFCKTPDGFIVTGGDSAARYIAKTKSWKKLGMLRGTRYAHGSVFVNGNLIICGGKVNNNESANVELLNLQDGRWQYGPLLPKKVEYPEMSCIGDDVYLLDVGMDRLFCMDGRRMSWDEKAPPPVDYCAGARMAPVQGQLCVVGGYGNIHVWYTPSTDTWSQAAPPLRVHAHSAVLLVGEDILILKGGENEIERYNLRSKSWSVCPLAMPRGIQHVFV